MDTTTSAIMEKYLPMETKYEQHRRKLTSKFPNLRYKDTKQWTTHKYHPRGNSVCIRFEAGGTSPTVRHLSDSEEVRDELIKSQSTNVSVRRLFLIEGCQDKRSQILGAHLGIPHLFWMRHEKVAIWEPTKDTAGNVPPLPSTTLGSRSFTRSYASMMRLSSDIRGFALRCAENERHIAVSRIRGELDGVGAVHRRASFWARTVGVDGWDALIVVDTPLKIVFGGRRDSWKVIKPKYTPTPFQGGYADFMSYEDLDDCLRTSGPPRTSAFDDLLYYYTNHWSALELTADPRSVAVFVDKLVASEYLLLIQYQRSLLSDLHWSLSRHQDFSVFNTRWVAESWSDLMSFQRRLLDHHSVVRDINLDLRLNSINRQAIEQQHENIRRRWHDSAQDFEYIDEELSKLIERTKDLVTAFNALSGAKAAEQSLLEAKNVRILTILGVTFVPLSLAAGIFSMTDQYSPGEPQFWVYFAVAVPLTTIVLIVATAATYGTGLVRKGIGTKLENVSPRAYQEFRNAAAYQGVTSQNV